MSAYADQNHALSLAAARLELPVLTLHLLWSILFIFRLLAPEGMNLLYTMIAGDII